MAIARTGLLNFNSPSMGASGTVSSTITVPAATNMVVVAFSGANAAIGTFSGNPPTFTKGGSDTIMTAATTAGDAVSGATNWQGALFYLADPDIGTNKSLKYNWGTTPTENYGKWGVAFYSGVGSVRDGDGDQSTSLPFTTPTMTAQTGDLISAFAVWFASSEGTIDTWSNLTEVSEFTKQDFADLAMAEGSPSGNTTVAASTGTNVSDGGIVAIVLAPAEAGAVPLGQIMLW